MDMVTKSVDAAVKPVESEHPNGEFEVILSTEDLDRDNENLYIDEWKQPLPARIHIDGDHGRTLEKTVGSAVPRIEGNKLIGKGTYAGTQYAQMVRQLVNEGHISHVSVTYGEKKGQKDSKPERELFNAAFVAIPANPKAEVLSSKSASVKPQTDGPTSLIETLKAAGGLSASGDNPRVPPKHDEMVQAMHDAACHLGAMCLNEIDADPGTADGANKSAVETSSSKDAGLPQESAEESAVSAAAEKSAAAETAEESADDAVKEHLALRARSLGFLVSKNFKE
jgi:hypothetical protein